jgi:hypothetical protein
MGKYLSETCDIISDEERGDWRKDLFKAIPRFVILVRDDVEKDIR